MVNPITILLTLVKKDLKILMRSKLSTFLILFGPFLLIFIIGTAFQSMNWHGINVGVYAPEYTPEVESVLNNLKVSEEITLYKIPSIEKCKEKVRSSELHICITLPTLQFKDNITASGNKIQMFVDYSRLNLAFALVDMMSTSIGKEKERISLELTRVLIDKLREVVDAVHTNSQYLTNFTGFGSEFSSKLDDMQKNLTALDINISLADLGIDEFADKINTTVDQIKTLQELGNESIKANRELISVLNTRIDSSETNINDIIIHLIETNQSIDEIKKGCEEQAITINLLLISEKLITPDQPFDCETWATSDLRSSIAGNKQLVFSVDQVCICIDSTNLLLADIYTMLNLLFLEQNFTELRIAINESNSSLENSASFLEEFRDNVETEVADLSTKVNELKQIANKTKDDLEIAKNLKENAEVEISFLRTNLNSGLSQVDYVADQIGNIDSSLTLFTNIQAEEVVQPITTQLIDLHSEKSTTFLMYPTLMILIMMLVGILAASTMVLGEKKTRASLRNFAIPIKPSFFLMGTYISNIAVLMVQLTFILLVGYFFFDIPIFSNIPLTMFILFLIATTFVLLGMFIGYIFVSDEIATLVAILTSISFLVFSGSLILPLEAMSENIAFFARFNPFVIGESALRKAFVLKLPIGDFLTEAITLLFYIAILVLLVVYAQRINKKRQSK